MSDSSNFDFGKLIPGFDFLQNLATSAKGVAAGPVSALRNMMESEVQRDPANQPTLEIDTAEDAEYGVLARVLAAAKNANMQKIGFVKK